jgi:hypothetical protein
MGIEVDELASSNLLSSNVDEVAQRIFEPRLEKLGLSASNIESQTLEQLGKSLDKINELIKHPEQLGEARLKVSGKLTILVATEHESQISVGALPTLLSRKELIIERIGALGGARAISSIRDLVDQLNDADVKVRLANELDELEEQRIAIDAARTELRRQEMATQSQERLLVLKTEARSRLFKEYVARESVASIVGGLLLILFGISLVVAMFTALESSEIVVNSFLIILGYFFGQAAAGRPPSNDTAANDAARS